MTSRVLLIGMMGAGKSTVGRELSQRLGWPYLDSDAEVIRHTGLTVPEIFAAHGEATFRAEEARVLEEATTSEGPVVVSVAGGAVLDSDNRRRIAAGGLVVWLRAEVATLAGRVGVGEGRPLLGDDPASALARLYAERRALYAQLAEVTIDVDGRRVGDIADAIVAALEEGGVTSRA
jgi:shikimate kinase